MVEGCGEVLGVVGRWSRRRICSGRRFGACLLEDGFGSLCSCHGMKFTRKRKVMERVMQEVGGEPDSIEESFIKVKWAGEVANGYSSEPGFQNYA